MKKEFHHIGIPSTQPRADEIHLDSLDVFITDATKHPHRVEWVRFGPACKLPSILSQRAHVAFAVDNLEEALKGHTVIAPPCEPLPGLQVAFILDDGAPVEFLQFAK